MNFPVASGKQRPPLAAGYQASLRMKLSIITINKDNARGLEKTIQSVAGQTFSDFEYIVIDGASSDGSVEVIKRYAGRMTYWVSESDTGTYNAMNKGIRKARGEYCLFLNSGDYLITGKTLEKAFKEIDNRADIYYSDMILDNGEITTYPDNIEISLLLNYPINHQNSLIRRSLFKKHGLYNENFKVVSDWEFLLFEKLKYKSTFKRLKTNIAVYASVGISSDIKFRRKEQFAMFDNVFDECSVIIKSYFTINKSIYMNIINNYGNTKLLDFILRVYRFIFCKLFHLRGKKL
jgi:glycosyltransferase involved in cell wall biosynthesis